MTNHTQAVGTKAIPIFHGIESSGCHMYKHPKAATLMKNHQNHGHPTCNLGVQVNSHSQQSSPCAAQRKSRTDAGAMPWT
jgi:hypothetical protein